MVAALAAWGQVIWAVTAEQHAADARRAVSEEPHPAAPYYPAPAFAPPPPKDLTAFGILAFATAATSTAFNVGTALLSGRMLRHYDDSTLDWSLAAYTLGSALEFAALIAGWVTGSLWLHRARLNAELLDPGAHHARSAGWAWGGWICPVVALWFPFQVVRDVLKAVSPSAGTSLLGWWWALYLVMTLSSNALGRYVGEATAEDASGVQSLSVFVAIATVVALLLWGRVLLTVTKAQHARMYAR